MLCSWQREKTLKPTWLRRNPIGQMIAQRFGCFRIGFDPDHLFRTPSFVFVRFLAFVRTNMDDGLAAKTLQPLRIIADHVHKCILSVVIRFL